MKVLYRLIKCHEDGKEKYGIEIAKQIHDVFQSEPEGKRFTSLCNKMGVSELHIEDILHDYLLEKEQKL